MTHKLTSDTAGPADEFQLSFADEYVPQILDGDKTATVRY